MADQTERLELATVKAEIASDIISRFSNDPVEAGPIHTDSGDIQNLKQVAAGIEATGQEAVNQAVSDGIVDLTAAVDSASDNADRSESFASLSAAASNPFDNTADGLSNTSGSGATNRFFSVSGSGDTLAILYRNDGGVPVEIGKSPNSKVVQAIKEKQPDIAPIGYAWALLDENYKAAIGVKENGTFAASKMESESLATQAVSVAETAIGADVCPGYAIGFSDGNGRVALGIKDDGTVAAEKMEAGDLDTRTLAAEEATVAEATMSMELYPGYVLVVRDDNGRVAYGVLEDGTVEAEAAKVANLTVNSINGRSYSAAAVSRLGGVYTHQLNFINNTGQSLGEGSTPAVAITTAQEYDNVGFPSRANAPVAFVPLTVANTQVGARGESPMYGTLGHIKELIAEENGIAYTENDYQLVTCNNAYGGSSITILNKGSSPYTLALSQVQSAFNIAQAAAKSMAFQAVTWTQGEADTGMAKNTYKAHLKQLASDYNVDGKAITGQFNDVKFICYQNATVNRNIALAQLEASHESPLIYMACPMYQFTYGDTQHINSESEKWLGGYYGLVYKRVIVDREDWQPLQPVSHAINGNTVDLIFNKMSLVLDTTLIPAQVNYGFDVLGSGGEAIAITSVEVIAPNRVRLKLASNPAPSWFVRYGFNVAVDKAPFVGGCGNLRDGQGDTLVYSAINKPMHNWCVIFNYSL